MQDKNRRKLRDVTNKTNRVLEEYGEPEKGCLVEDSELMEEDESSELIPECLIWKNKS